MNYSKWTDISRDLAQGKLTLVSLVKHYLKNIEDQQDLNVFLEVYAEEALKKAEEIDLKIKQGTAGKLAGMVVGLKDVLCYKDHGLSASSKILKGFVSQFTGTAVQRLLDQDAIIIGRQNCDEFAMGSTNENSAFGPTKNAADKTKVPGGSSGGSAVSVQADMCLVALGSDTGGSVRQPASFCGIYGLKPSYARISRWGLIAYASSFDCIGIFGKSVEDVALVLETIAGADGKDSTVSKREVPQYSQYLSPKLSPELSQRKTYNVGYLKEGLESEGLQKEVRDAMLYKIKQMQEMGHTVEPIDMPLLKYTLPTYYILTTAEASSNLSRYDGVKFGLRSSEAKDLTSLYKKTRSEGFGPEVKRRIMLGTFVLSASYFDAYFTKAQKVRRKIKEEFNEFFASYDFLLTPTAPTTAFALGQFSGDPLAMYLADIFTVSANIVGVPAISIPCGVDDSGLPIGLQLMANDFEETKLLAFSHALAGLNS